MRMSDRPPIPEPVKRELRQETNFGCAICGCPVICYHHIIPWEEKEHHNPEHMIVLCPTHHRPADDGAIPRSKLYDLKENPENSDSVDYLFEFDPTSPVIRLGNCNFGFGADAECTLIELEGEELIRTKYADNRLFFDIKFYSKDGELIAELSNNEWWADSTDLWDVVYKSNSITLRRKKGSIGLKIEHHPDNSIISFRGVFYYGGEKVVVHPSKIKIHPDNDITASNLS